MNFTCVVIQTPTLRPNNSSTIFMPRWSPTLPVWPRVVNTGVYYILTTTANTRPTMSSQSTHQPQPWFPRWWFTLPVTLIGRILLWDLAEVQVVFTSQTREPREQPMFTAWRNLTLSIRIKYCKMQRKLHTRKFTHVLACKYVNGMWLIYYRLLNMHDQYVLGLYFFLIQIEFQYHFYFTNKLCNFWTPSILA